MERKRGRISRVKYWKTTLSILAALSASLALAEDFKTTKGKEYKNATISRVEPDGIVIRFSGGTVKIAFTELPKEVQERFHYDPVKAAEFNAASQAAVAQSNASAQTGAAQQEQKKAIERQSQALHLLIEEVVPNGVLADPMNGGYVDHSSVRASRSARVGGGGGVYAGGGGPVLEYSPSGKTIFVRGITGVAEGDQMSVQAYPDGTHTTDAGRTVQKWIFVRRLDK